MKKFLLLSTLIFICNNVSSAYTFGGTGNDKGIHFIKTLDGGYLLAGQYANPNQLIYLIKLSPTLTVEWTKTYGDSVQLNRVGYVAQAQDSGYVIMGTLGDFTFNSIAWMIRTDAQGDSLFSQ